MALMKTSNPALGDKTFRDLAASGPGGLVDAVGQMTLNGTGEQDRRTGCYA